MKTFRTLRIGAFLRKGDQFYRYLPNRWIAVDRDQIRSFGGRCFKGGIPEWYKGRFRRRISK